MSAVRNATDNVSQTKKRNRAVSVCGQISNTVCFLVPRFKLYYNMLSYLHPLILSYPNNYPTINTTIICKIILQHRNGFSFWMQAHLFSLFTPNTVLKTTRNGFPNKFTLSKYYLSNKICIV